MSTLTETEADGGIEAKVKKCGKPKLIWIRFVMIWRHQDITSSEYKVTSRKSNKYKDTKQYDYKVANDEYQVINQK